MECRACCYWFKCIQIHSGVLPLSRVHMLLEGPLWAIQWPWEGCGVAEDSSIQAHPRWHADSGDKSGKGRLSCTQIKKQIKGWIPALLECELDGGKWTEEGQRPRLVGMQEAQGQLSVCLGGNTILGSTSTKSMGPFLLMFLQPTFLKCLLPGIAQDLWDGLRMKTQRSLLSWSSHLPECDNKNNKW